MTRNARFPAFLALTLICAFPVWAQYIQEGARGSMVGTVADVDEARGQVLVDPDDHGPRVTVLSDSVSTQYNGFGGVINGQPEIFAGSQGLANVRAGDRIEVRGSGQANYTVRADFIRLLGRATAAPQTGVGSSRPVGSVGTPTASTTSRSSSVSPVEGTIQDVNAQLAESFGLDRPRGALVSSVEKDGPASKSGLMPGDVILTGTPSGVGAIRAGDELEAKIGDWPPLQNRVTNAREISSSPKIR